MGISLVRRIIEPFSLRVVINFNNLGRNVIYFTKLQRVKDDIVTNIEIIYLGHVQSPSVTGGLKYIF